MPQRDFKVVRRCAAVPALTQALKDPDEQVRREAKEALERIVPPGGP